MENWHSKKPGFRVTVFKRDSSTVIDLLQVQRGCTTARLDHLTLILLGEVVDEKGFLSAAEILDRVQHSGVDCARDFDGAFVLLLVSDTSAPPNVITDPLNSLKCFIEETPEAFILASSLCFLPARARALDRIGITSFLANGVIYNHRTIFDGVRSLSRASIHTIDSRTGPHSRTYWEYKFDDGFSKRSRKDLKEELASLLLNAAKRRINPAEKIYLSLSGGYDSTCVLGLLSRIRPEKLECFSYITDQASTGSDETVAQQMAKIAGFPHRSVIFFQGDFIDLVRRNAAMGECRANFCGELDAWQSIQNEMSEDGVFFVGDECFGWSDCRLCSVQDILASIPIQRAGVLSKYADCLNSEALGGDYDREILAITEAALAQDLHRTKDFLYLDQRLGNVIMPWRELFGGRHTPLRNLLLDRRILDFMTHVPSSLRRGKKLYKETVRMMFPELFRVKRAFRPQKDYVKMAIHQQRERIESELLGGESSRIDEWFALRKCAELLQHARPADAPSLKKKALIFGKKMFKESPLAHTFKGLFPPTPMTNVDPLVLLTRILTLREYLRNPE